MIVRGIEFKPLYWNFTEDGTLGRVFFSVPKNTFKESGSCNGAYALNDYNEYDFAKFEINDGGAFSEQIVYLCIDCAICEKDCLSLPLINVLEECAEFICDNLELFNKEDMPLRERILDVVDSLRREEFFRGMGTAEESINEQQEIRRQMDAGIEFPLALEKISEMKHEAIENIAKLKLELDELIKDL